MIAKITIALVVTYDRAIKKLTGVSPKLCDYEYSWGTDTITSAGRKFLGHFPETHYIVARALIAHKLRMGSDCEYLRFIHSRQEHVRPGSKPKEANTNLTRIFGDGEGRFFELFEEFSGTLKCNGEKLPYGNVNVKIRLSEGGGYDIASDEVLRVIVVGINTVQGKFFPQDFSGSLFAKDVPPSAAESSRPTEAATRASIVGDEVQEPIEAPSLPPSETLDESTSTPLEPIDVPPDSLDGSDGRPLPPKRVSDPLQFVARVYALTADGQGTNGTAYPISPNRVITAAHVLMKEDRNDSILWHEEVQILWPQLSATEAPGWQSATVKWNGYAEGFDVAVLETRFPEQIVGYAEPAWMPPPIGQEFSLCGFSVEGAPGEHRNAVRFPARISPFLPFEEVVPVEVLGEPHVETGWKGAAGAPLLIDGRHYGALVGGPYGLGMPQVQASLMQHWICHPGFVSAAGISLDQIDEERRTVSQCEIAALLCEQAVFAANLLRRLPERRGMNAPLDRMSESAQMERLAGILLSKAVQTNAILKAMREALQETYGSPTIHPATILRILRWLLPMRAATRLPLLLHLEDGGILSLEAFTEAVAELALARVEGRAADFKKRDKPNDLPRGSRAVSKRELFPPEAVCDFTPEGMAAATIDHFYSKYTVPDAETGDGVPLVGQEGQRVTNPQVKERVLRLLLRKLGQDGGRASIIFNADDLRETGGILREAFKVVKRRLPDVHFVFLKGDQEQYATELEELDNLAELVDELLTFARKS